MLALDESQGVGEEEAGTAHTFLTFRLTGQCLAVDVAQIREIPDVQPVARVPVLGVTAVRGEGVAMIDLSGHLSMHGGDESADARIIVLDLRRGQGRRALALPAERVIDVVDAPPEATEAVPVEPTTRWGGSTVMGMTGLVGELFMIVDLRLLLAAGSHNGLPH